MGSTGLRRPDGTSVTDLLPGEYCRRGSRWHEDGTITVTPSIDFTPNYHGFLAHGAWT